MRGLFHIQMLAFICRLIIVYVFHYSGDSVLWLSIWVWLKLQKLPKQWETFKTQYFWVCTKNYVLLNLYWYNVDYVWSWVANGSETSAHHDLNYLISWFCSKTSIIAEELVYWTLKTRNTYQFKRNEIILRSLCTELFKMSNIKELWFIYFCTHLQNIFIQVHLEMEYFRSKLLIMDFDVINTYFLM